MITKQKHVSLLKTARKIHRTTGIILFIFFFIIAISGLLLGWKKNSNGLILPKSYKGATQNVNNWLPLKKYFTSCDYGISIKMNEDSKGEKIFRMDDLKKGFSKIS